MDKNQFDLKLNPKLTTLPVHAATLPLLNGNGGHLAIVTAESHNIKEHTETSANSSCNTFADVLSDQASVSLSINPQNVGRAQSNPKDGAGNKKMGYVITLPTEKLLKNKDSSYLAIQECVHSI